MHCKPIPVIRTGFSLCSIFNREKPVFITGIPANENRFFPVWKYYTGKTLFWPCADPVRLQGMQKKCESQVIFEVHALLLTSLIVFQLHVMVMKNLEDTVALDVVTICLISLKNW